MGIKKKTIHDSLPDTRNPDAKCFTCKFAMEPPFAVQVFLGKSNRGDGTDTQLHWAGCSHKDKFSLYRIAPDECGLYEEG